MKIFTILICQICLIVGTSGFVFAVDSTPSAATPSAKAQDLLDRVATKVAQIANQQKRTYHGVVKSTGTNSYSLTTDEGDRTIVTNDATNFYRTKAGKRSPSDFKGIKIGEDIAAIGTIDPNNKSMTAKQVIQKIKRTIFVGKVETVDKSVVTVTGTKIDLADSNYDSKEIAVGKLIFILAHTKDPKTGIYSSLKVLIINK